MNPKEKIRLQRKVAAREELRKRDLKRMQDEFSIYAIVDMNLNIIRSWQYSLSGYKEVSTKLKPTILVPEAYEKFLLTPKGIKVLIGGRDGGKSVFANNFLTCLMKDKKHEVLCLREFSKNTKNSTYKSLTNTIEEKCFSKFTIQEKIIKHENGSELTFDGFARNIEGIKSSNTVDIGFIDEAETMTENSIDVFLPTIRKKGCEVWLIANPQSAGDPFSKEFIIPYQKQIEKHGYYEDELVLVIKTTYKDCPWHKGSKNELLRKKQKATYSETKYNHIWLGCFNDEVEDAIIDAEWFDAAIDVHKNPLYANKFKPKGVKIAAHDVADTGDDNKAYAMRHGSIIYNVKDKSDGDIADGADWATESAIADGAGLFTFDASGMGVGIRRDVIKAFNGLKIEIDEHKGGSTPDFPNVVYEGYDSNDSKNKRTNKEVFKNKRAQYLWRLRDRFFNTYRMVVKGEYVNPDECISLDSETIEDMQALRAEICRQPLKYNPSGLIQMMSKQDMKKLGIASPNMLDAVAMTMIYPKATFQEDEDFFTEELPQEF